jgi:prepilin signal peptidase PulO-like enzyme (type II secretory pathway)
MIASLALELLLPAWSLYLIVFLFGVIIGSFLNVYIYRFHTGKSINGNSHCLSCAKPLRWYELFPLLSYLGLRGRCGGCGCRIPIRYFVVELLTGALFVLGASVASDLIEFAWLLGMLIVLLLITVYDYYHFIIPDEFSVTLMILMASWLSWQWWSGVLSPVELLWTIGAALAAAAFFFALWAISRGAWLGFGDVKLAIPLGLWVGPLGVFSFVVGSFWVGAVISIFIMGWHRYQRGQKRLQLSSQSLTMKSAVPFAPFMIIGAALVYFLQFDALSLFSFI